MEEYNWKHGKNDTKKLNLEFLPFPSN